VVCARGFSGKFFGETISLFLSFFLNADLVMDVEKSRITPGQRIYSLAWKAKERRRGGCFL